MQHQQRRPLTNYSHRKGCLKAQTLQRPPLHFQRQVPGLRVQQLGDQTIKQAFQGATGLGSAAPTNASSNAPGVTANGRWCRSDPSRQAKAHTCCR